MTNRYVITLLHWLTSVIVGSVLLTILSGMSVNVFLLSLVFGGGASILFFLFSLIFIPRILKFIQSKTTRVAALTIYSAASCFGGFTLLVAFDIIQWSEIFTWKKNENVLFTDVDDGLGIAFYAFMIATMLSSVMWASVYKPKEEVPVDLGVLDQI